MQKQSKKEKYTKEGSGNQDSKYFIDNSGFCQKTETYFNSLKKKQKPKRCFIKQKERKKYEEWAENGKKTSKLKSQN